MKEKRGSWYLLTGLVIGVTLGLVYAWFLRPVEYTDSSPASLSSNYKDKYRALIAAAYLANGDLVRAKARLSLLGDSDIYTTLAQQAQRALADGSSPQEARALGMLSVALGQGAGPGQSTVVSASAQPAQILTAAPQRSPSPSAQIGLAVAATSAASTPSLETQTLTVSLAAPSTLILTVTPTVTSQDAITPTLQPTSGPTATPTPAPSLTPTRTPTFAPLPTRTMTPTPGAPFVLDKRETICDQNLGEAQIQVETFDDQGQPVPGVEIVVTWEGGEEHFYTGLKPELGMGYADFTLTPGVSYNLRLAEGGQPITDLTAPECALSGGERYWGAWRLTFVQP
jgi:hypothetical protein